MHPDPEHEDKQNYFLDKAIFIDGINVQESRFLERDCLGLNQSFAITSHVILDKFFDL